jgi:uncharacterized ParB-like nuclease family protein
MAQRTAKPKHIKTPKKETEMTILNIKLIRMDCGTQSRDANDQEHIDYLAEQIQSGETLPPVTVVHDGLEYYLADGFHRVHAHIKLGKASINCDVVTGTLRHAIDLSGMANKTHGLNRSHATKRKQTLIYLEDFEWSELSDRVIAKKVGVSHPFVAGLRAELNGDVKKPQAAKQSKAAKKTFQKPPEPEVDLSDEPDEMVEELIKENQRLSDQLAIKAMAGTEEEKNLAHETIESLREELRVAKLELVAVKQSRDTYQSENAQLKKQVAMLQKQLKK